MANDEIAQNRILNGLPASEAERVAGHLQHVDLPAGHVLYEPGQEVEHVHFITAGVGSLMTPMPEGPPIEMASVGNEGMVGIPVFLAAHSTRSRAFMQVAGEGARMDADAFRAALKQCPTLNHLLLRYTLALMNEMAQNAACTRTHSIGERCARWLLMTCDRVKQDTFELTQEFLALMVGARRPSVSIAAGVLAKDGYISYVRGRMTILDRAGLESVACECYGAIRNEFDRLVGAKPSPA